MLKLIDFDKWNTGTYCEIGQTNPLRWMNVKKTGDNEYTCLSRWWKCKDFMNEVVTSSHTGKDYSIYGFTVTNKDWFSEGKQVWWLLKSVGSAFYHNIAIVNAFLESQGMPPVEAVKSEKYWLITCPPKYLDNTMFMSQVTLFIRLASCNVQCNTLEEMLAQPENAGDRYNFAACVQKPLGKFPKALEKYVWYYPGGNGLSKDHLNGDFMTSHMHNCGVVSWGWK